MFQVADRISAAKLSRPSRVYLHLTDPVHLSALSERVRQTRFPDARSTSNDTSLLGPPSLEFAPFGRLPSGKLRKDARQGTIDLDSEFISFLESLTNPSEAKPSMAETGDGSAGKK